MGLGQDSVDAGLPASEQGRIGVSAASEVEDVPRPPRRRQGTVSGTETR